MILVWDLATGRCLRSLDERRGPARPRIHWPDVGASRLLRGFRGDTDPTSVRSLALSADGRHLLSAATIDEVVRLWDLTTGRCVHTIGVPGTLVEGLGWSRDGRYVFAGTGDGVRVWEVDWELEVRDPADWDEGARPYLTVFLTQQTPFAPGEPVRRGEPSWDEADFQRLLRELRHAGYGWLRPEGVRAELARMARDWRGPPAPPEA